MKTLAAAMSICSLVDAFSPCGGITRHGRTQIVMHSSPVSTEETAAPSVTEKEETASFAVRWSSAILDRVFRYKPLLNFMSAKARGMIRKRGDKIGANWSEEVDSLLSLRDNLEAEFESLYSQKTDENTPEYYKVPFHAYSEGNLCWDAAVEVIPAAKTVHANLFTEDRNDFRLDGDETLRRRFMEELQSEMEVRRLRDPQTVVDIGCSSGLSTLRLADSFPSSQVTGVDLSPYFLAVANHKLKDSENQDHKNRIAYLHAAAEATGMADSSVDMVTICLVNHELPAAAARDVYREAYRILKPGGVLSLMDANPASDNWRRLARNPIALAAFRSTEPYMDEYVNFDMKIELQRSGFRSVTFRYNSPRHRTVIAEKL
uniref:Methyltransferase type 11 domain-containing protein n=1 Tax=Chromera velia CCMP2878 TaxID=1169474 RepID=A0A0G4GWH0_9ALVE|eukprot:Cvel_23606.t1-p1 / transcript=Cvel_23606.t1 / gene=Cvel_23606 / organism=Chromera_velia_CCMP2878 / gene_product=Demethylmenaquinone methyltransferase, putative / transcript_product=Demethylmenaquinone methyltransferase, putative / location=Cvel_scaffold2451:15797-20457(+) / protein_length=374 / sequence_SO=supercontig / SO=protein_coding / is_pseudo=false